MNWWSSKECTPLAIVKHKHKWMWSSIVEVLTPPVKLRCTVRKCPMHTFCTACFLFFSFCFKQTYTLLWQTSTYIHFYAFPKKESWLSMHTESHKHRTITFGVKVYTPFWLTYYVTETHQLYNLKGTVSKEAPRGPYPQKWNRKQTRRSEHFF